MSFKAYIDNIKLITGKTPEEFIVIAKKNNVFEKKPSEIILWLKKEFGLGLGHARAIYAIFKQKGLVKK